MYKEGGEYGNKNYVKKSVAKPPHMENSANVLLNLVAEIIDGREEQQDVLQNVACSGTVYTNSKQSTSTLPCFE